MDDAEFKKTLHKVNALHCVYEKAILARHARCPQAIRRYIGEREAVGCDCAAEQLRCTAWLGLLRDQSRFALGLSSSAGKLTHGRAMKLQVGGLKGLATLLKQPPDDLQVAPLLQQAERTWGNLNQVPFEQLIPTLAAFKGRQPRR